MKPQLARNKMKDNKFAQLPGNRILSVEYAKRISRKRPHLHIRHAISRRTWLPAPSRRKNFWEGRNSSRFLGNFAEKKYREGRRIIFHSGSNFLRGVALM